MDQDATVKWREADDILAVNLNKHYVGRLLYIQYLEVGKRQADHDAVASDMKRAVEYLDIYIAIKTNGECESPAHVDGIVDSFPRGQYRPVYD